MSLKVEMVAAAVMGNVLEGVEAGDRGDEEKSGSSVSRGPT